jgi:sugar O-acyltransferase (sialic acid O-acetyltransferase NeuD family)
MDVVLIGAGGHAKAIVEIIRARGDRLVGYLDPKPSTWLDAPHFPPAAGFDDRRASIVIGFGAVSPEHLQHRLNVLDEWINRGFAAPAVVHASAAVSNSARLEPGVTILAKAVVQPNAVVGRGAIVNTGAIIEHDTVIGAGTHVAPGAIVLGDVKVGACAMIGAGAVVLQQSKIPPGTLVKATQLAGRTESA